MDFQSFRLQALVSALSRAFMRDTRTSGEEFTRLADDSPEWMRDIVRACHGNMMPDDWRYRMIEECADALADREPDQWEDDSHEIADSLVDVYNGPRLQWLASRLDRSAYVDEARDEGLISPDADTFDQLGIGQFMEYREILDLLIRAIGDTADDIDPTPDDFRAWCRAHQHMQPVVYVGDFYRVETSEGSEIVPAELAYTPKTADDMRDYLQGEPDDIDAPIVKESGYLARMSAAGYMDCTDWTAHDSESDAWQYLIENYGE